MTSDRVGSREDGDPGWDCADDAGLTDTEQRERRVTVSSQRNKAQTYLILCCSMASSRAEW